MWVWAVNGFGLALTNIIDSHVHPSSAPSPGASPSPVCPSRWPLPHPQVLRADLKGKASPWPLPHPSTPSPGASPSSIDPSPWPHPHPQVLRADLKELWTLDLKGKPYAYTPFCTSREETLGFQVTAFLSPDLCPT